MTKRTIVSHVFTGMHVTLTSPNRFAITLLESSQSSLAIPARQPILTPFPLLHIYYPNHCTAHAETKAQNTVPTATQHRTLPTKKGTVRPPLPNNAISTFFPNPTQCSHCSGNLYITSVGFFFLNVIEPDN